MRNIAVIGFIVSVGFVLEYVCAELFSGWFCPNVLIVVVVFFNLFRGVRQSLVAAFFAGLLRDSFSPQLFGLHIFVFMLCAYLTTFVKIYIYHSGSKDLRVLMACVMTVLYVVIQSLVRMMFMDVNFGQVIRCILLPELISTALVAGYVFVQLKKCALKLFA